MLVLASRKKGFCVSRRDGWFTEEELVCDEIKPKFSITGEGIMRQLLERDVIVDSDDAS